MQFKDRIDAGKQLAQELKVYKNDPEAITIALPRGGVVIGFEISKALNLPLDIVVPRKIGAPGNEEFAIGAVAEDGEPMLNEEVVKLYNISKKYIDETIEKEKKEAQRRLKTYRGDRQPLDLKNKTAIIVDDGIATGATMIAAIHSTKAKGASKIVVAVPVGAPDSVEKVRALVDEVVCMDTPAFFGAVGAFYEVFPQTTDEEVIGMLKNSKSSEKS